MTQFTTSILLSQNQMRIFQNTSEFKTLVNFKMQEKEKKEGCSQQLSTNFFTDESINHWA